MGNLRVKSVDGGLLFEKYNKYGILEVEDYVFRNKFESEAAFLTYAMEKFKDMWCKNEKK